MRHFLCTLLAGAAIASSCGAHAESRVGVTINDNKFYDSSFAPTENGPYNFHYVEGDLITQTYNAGSANQPYSAENAGRAKFGALGVSAFAASYSDGHGEPVIKVEAYSRAFWQDSITVQSTTEAFGTPVRLFITSYVHVDGESQISASWVQPLLEPVCGKTNHLFSTGVCTSTGQFAPTATISALFAVDGFTNQDNGLGYSIYNEFSTAGQFGIGWTQLVFYKDTYVGATLDIKARFETEAFQYNPITYLNGFAGSGFFGIGTASSYLSFSSSNATAVAASGHDYTAPIAAVPEPTTWAMIIAGFGIMGTSLRRRRSIVSALQLT
jgi:PEP-CTERM motif